MNCPDFELLSAYADGETTPAEASLVEQHRPECPTCSQYLTNLGCISHALRQPEPLPQGLKIRVRPRPRAGWWQKLRELADSPVVHLVSAQRRRRARFGPAEMFKIMAVFALPVFFMTISSDRSPLLAFLVISAIGLMLGLPLRQFSEEVALLASLRRGRCLEEIVGTGTSAQGLLDGLALQGLFQISRAVLTVWPVLLLGTLGVPDYWRPRALQMEVAWLPGLLVLFLAGYYLAQLVQVWNPGVPRRLGALLAVSSPWTLALFGLPGCLVAGLLTALVARLLAIYELEHPAQVRAVPPHRRNRLVRSWSENPITRRELSRLAGRMGAGWHRLLLWRASMALAPLAWGLYALQQPFEQWSGLLPPAVLLFSALFFVRSATLTLPAVVRERELQSWHILMQTPLAPSTVVRGWLQVCFYTMASEGFFVLLVLGGYLLGVVPPSQWPGPLAGLLLLPASCWLGAYVGLALSAASRTQREAGQRFILWSLAGLVLWLIGWGLGQGLRGSLAETPGVLFGPISELALAPVWLVLAWRARPLMRQLPCIDPRGPEQVTTHYSPALVPLDLGSLLALGYGLACWNALAQAADLSALKGATLLLVGSLAWLLCVRLPLATLAEILQGRRLSLLLGPVFGLWLGWTTYLATLALGDHFREIGLLGVEIEFAYLLGGLVVGAVAGAMAARNATCGALRSRQLKPRLARSGSLSAVVLVALGSALPSLEIPYTSRDYRSLSNVSVYHAQLAKARDLDFSSTEFYLAQGRYESPPVGGSAAVWSDYARRRANTSGLQRLRRQLPLFGQAAPVAGTWDDTDCWQINHYLEAGLHCQSLLYAEAGQDHAAVNCDRWALLCLDSRRHYESDGAMQLNDENDARWILDDLRSHILKGHVEPGLIQQLLNREFVTSWLVYSYELLTYQPYFRGGEQLDRLLPAAYMHREQLAADLARKRAQTLADGFKLWELSHDGGVELLEGLRFTPLTRNQVYRRTVGNEVEGLARYWSRREGLALLAAIQLYRRDHGQQWPDNLEQVQKYLPRPARCYLNQAGTFDYSPGVLSCSRDDGSERLMICNHGK
ncbi:hypothetical protein ABS71_00625 [bacterium SCN 62-11]|nr:zf-HC2 domain-containing protein [Candidatus Eremiobacteraeota bacterium]ODT80260.1 MAG: hypothetical protein ABS71_00625 [bacterium SCN 62-11]